MSKSYYCPNCGAKLVQERLGRQWCPYCDILYDVPSDEDRPRSISWGH